MQKKFLAVLSGLCFGVAGAQAGTLDAQQASAPQQETSTAQQQVSPAQQETPLTPQATLPAGTALRVELNHRVRIRKNAVVTGHLTEPVYLSDHLVVPAGALVAGSIAGTHAGPRADRVRRLLAADFTPPRQPELLFRTLTLPAANGAPARVIQIDAPGVATEASVLTLGVKTQKQSIGARFKGMVKQRIQDFKALFKHHDFTEIIEKWAVGQLPYHPEIIWSGAHFNADLATPAVLPDVPHTAVPVEDLRGHLPEGTLHARLLSSLTSQTAKKGDPVEAVITQPLFSADKTRLLVPEGTHLFGVVVQTRAARRLGHNGDLRFAFRNLDLPTAAGEPGRTEIHGRLSAAQTAAGEHVTIDEEGQAKSGDGPGKYAEPLLLAVLATAGTHDDDHHHDGGTGGPGAGATTVASNGFGLIARVVSLSTANTSALQAFAYYALAKSIFYNFIAKGHETTFAHDTEIQVTLSER